MPMALRKAAFDAVFLNIFAPLCCLVGKFLLVKLAKRELD